LSFLIQETLFLLTKYDFWCEKRCFLLQNDIFTVRNAVSWVKMKFLQPEKALLIAKIRFCNKKQRF